LQEFPDAVDGLALGYKEPLNLDASIQILNLIPPREEMVMYASAVSKDRHSWKTIPRNPVAVWVHAAFDTPHSTNFLMGIESSPAKVRPYSDSASEVCG
jgi:hypothetical protein